MWKYKKVKFFIIYGVDEILVDFSPDEGNAVRNYVMTNKKKVIEHVSVQTDNKILRKFSRVFF